MKRADIEKIAKDMESIGYEIRELKAISYQEIYCRDVFTGGYELKIVPIRDKAEANANGNNG